MPVRPSRSAPRPGRPRGRGARGAPGALPALAFAPALAPALAFALAVCTAVGGCNDGDSSAQVAPRPAEDTLASVLARADHLSLVSEALQDTGLAEVFDGTASYTILAPRDAAFAAAIHGDGPGNGEKAAIVAAILREHVLPGALTPQDIAEAIERQRGPVRMETMGSGVLTFAAGDGGITVTAPDGSSARLAGAALAASNGVAIPIDAVLKTGAAGARNADPPPARGQ